MSHKIVCFFSDLSLFFFQSSTGSLRRAVQNVIEQVGHYPTADISLQCGQICRSSPAASSSHVSVASHATPPLAVEKPGPTAVKSRTISTQTGSSIQRDFFHVNNWLDHCIVSIVYAIAYDVLK